MKENLIQLFVISNKNKFPSNKMSEIRERMSEMTDKQLLIAQSLDYKSPDMTFSISFFFGYLGIDRFLIDQIVLGTLKLITLGGLGIWMIIDWFFIINITRRHNFKIFMQFAKTTSKISPI